MAGNYLLRTAVRLSSCARN